MRRREFLRNAALALPAISETLIHAAPAPIPIIDTHIHLFDPTRPQGAPWPEKDDAVLYRPALPDRYKKIIQGLNVVGAIAIECSPWESDNSWLLGVAEKDPVMVGIIGDLIPGSSSFRNSLENLAASPLFRGIRYGNLWKRNLGQDLEKPGFIADLKFLAQSKLVLDSANPDGALIAALLRVKEEVPELTIVVDHLPNAQIPSTPSDRKTYEANVKALGNAPSVFVKLSEIPQRLGDRVSLDLSVYRDKLDVIWETFGEDRLLYGSDWPNSDHLVPYAQTLRLVQQYVATKGPEAQGKFFWRNSIAAYSWRPRSASQPTLSS